MSTVSSEQIVLWHTGQVLWKRRNHFSRHQQCKTCLHPRQCTGWVVRTSSRQIVHVRGSSLDSNGLSSLHHEACHCCKDFTGAASSRCSSLRFGVAVNIFGQSTVVHVRYGYWTRSHNLNVTLLVIHYLISLMPIATAQPHTAHWWVNIIYKNSSTYRIPINV